MDSSLFSECTLKSNHFINAHLIRKKSNLHKIFLKHSISKRQADGHQQQNYTIEVAVFTDLALFMKHLPITKGNPNVLREIIDGIMNGVNAIFRHASFGVPMNVVIVRYIKQMDNSRLYSNYNESASDLLREFCMYQKTLKIDNDTSENHWDLALLLTGRDLHNANGKNRHSVTGTAYVSSMCSRESCALSELGVYYRKNSTQGLNIIYTIAHEIGHT